MSSDHRFSKINNLVGRLSNLLFGSSAERVSGILAFPLDVGLGFRGLFFVGLDQHGADEAQECVFAGSEEDQKTAWGAVFLMNPGLDGAPFEFLLDGAFDRIRSAQSFAMMFRQGEDGEAVGNVFLVLCG